MQLSSIRLTNPILGLLLQGSLETLNSGSNEDLSLPSGVRSLSSLNALSSPFPQKFWEISRELFEQLLSLASQSSHPLHSGEAQRPALPTGVFSLNRLYEVQVGTAGHAAVWSPLEHNWSVPELSDSLKGSLSNLLYSGESFSLTARKPTADPSLAVIKNPLPGPFARPEAVQRSNPKLTEARRRPYEANTSKPLAKKRGDRLAKPSRNLFTRAKQLLAQLWNSLPP